MIFWSTQIDHKGRRQYLPMHATDAKAKKIYFGRSRIGNTSGFIEYFLSFKGVEKHISLLHFHCCSEKGLPETVV